MIARRESKQALRQNCFRSWQKLCSGSDVKFPPTDDPPPGFINRIQVERIGGVGPWTGRAVQLHALTAARNGLLRLDRYSHPATLRSLVTKAPDADSQEDDGEAGQDSRGQ